MDLLLHKASSWVNKNMQNLNFSLKTGSMPMSEFHFNYVPWDQLEQVQHLSTPIAKITSP